MLLSQKKAFFVIGSINQTTQMHQISKHLPEFDPYFSQYFGNHPIIRATTEWGWFDYSILGKGQFKLNADDYLKEHDLKNDYRGKVYNHDYDLTFLCNDLIVPKIVRRSKSIWVQEGMIDRMTKWAKVVHRLKLPRYLALGTSLNGSSNLCDIFCVASEGYKEHLVKMGTDPEKIIVTGIPNFDDPKAFLDNDFPERDYVLVATSDIREVLGKDDRMSFLHHCKEIVGNRRVLFKLHPNEQRERAVAEIHSIFPDDTIVLSEGNTSEIIANCTELITQYSTVVYTGIQLGKKVHSYFDIDELYRLCPVDTNGTSAEIIAEIGRQFAAYKGDSKSFLREYRKEPEWKA